MNVPQNAADIHYVRDQTEGARLVRTTMTLTANALAQWLIVRLAGQSFGVEVRCVRELATTQDKHIAPLPRLPDGMVGVLKLRDEVLPVADLRRLLGLPALAAETAALVQLLKDREQDHVNWLRELEACVRERRPFQLATDPHECKFGKWYDTLVADENTVAELCNGDRILVHTLSQFDAPHKRIHSIAQAVTEAAVRDGVEEAQAIIDRTRDGDLAAMIQLFAATRSTLAERRHPLLVVLSLFGRNVAALVDSVEAVTTVGEGMLTDEGQTNLSSAMVVGFMRSQGEQTDKPTPLLDIAAVLAPCFGTVGAPNNSSPAC